MNLDAIAVRSLLILLLGLTVALILRRRTAATRHLVYAGTLLSMVLLPVLRQWGPTRSIEIGNLPAPIREFASRVNTLPSPTFTVQSSVMPAASQGASHLLVNGLLAVWALGCTLLIARLFVGIALTSKLMKRSERLYLFGSEEYEIRVAEGVQVPATTWIGRQVILLPASYVSWPDERVRSVVLHEAAHIARRDWIVQLFGRVACALYWPNPLVWLANRRMVDSAEQAADDLVLQAGVTPSRYAEDLLHIARTVRRNQPALTIPMAMKNDVGRRIEMVLDNRKRRGSVHLGGLALAAIGFATITIPAAALLLHRQGEVSTTTYADLKSGKTTPGSSANGYTARLADGRTVELVGVGWRLPDGTIQAWKPDGTLIPRSKQTPGKFPHTDDLNWLAFVYRLKRAGDVAHAGMDFAEASKSQSQGEIFAEGWPEPGRAGEDMLVQCLMQVRQRGVADPASFVFYIADGAPMTAASYDTSTGAIKENPDFPQRLAVNAEAVAHPMQAGSSGKPTPSTVPATTVSYDYAPSPMSYLTDAVGIDRSGNTVRSNALGASRLSSNQIRMTDWFPRDVGISRIEVQLRDLHAVEMLGVHLRPNAVVSG